LSRPRLWGEALNKNPPGFTQHIFKKSLTEFHYLEKAPAADLRLPGGKSAPINLQLLRLQP
jgi:hypothetical protein